MLRLLPLILIALAVLAPTAEAKTTCRSGETVYKQQGVRIFSISRAGDDYYSACGPRTRKPVRIEILSEAYGGLGVIGRSGDKVLWETSTSGEGGGEYSTVGWFDARTGETRSGVLAGEVGNKVLDVIVAKDGSVGVLVAGDLDGGELRVGYLARGPKQGSLRGELVVASAGEGYVKRSLAFADEDRVLTWNSGRPRSVPVTGEQLTCAAGTTLAESEGARVFEVLQRRKIVLAECAAGATTVHQLAVGDVEHQQFFALSSLKRAGARVAFAVSENAVGVIEGGQVTFTRPDGIDAVRDVAIGAAGAPVFAGLTRDGGQSVISRLTGERIALQGGQLEPGSLAVGEDGRVTWMTAGDLPQSVPLAGETVIDCTTGTTVLSGSGLRVFELLLAGAQDARLLACPPGATAPVQLLTAPRTASWGGFELARENGRFAVYAAGASRGAVDQVLNFDADDVVAGTPRSAYGDTKDVALSADGRSAFAIRSTGKWKIVAFAGSGVERTLAKPSDGVQVGSLAIDGARVVWRNRSGAERGAAL